MNDPTKPLPWGPAPGPLDLDGLDRWIIERGMQGLPIEEQLDGFCRRVYDAGYPMKRAQAGMGTLHPRFGAHTFIWRPDAPIEHTPRERTALGDPAYLRSPVHFMRSRGELMLRRRLDRCDPNEFAVFPELIAEGLTDYAAVIVPFDTPTYQTLTRVSPVSGQPPLPGTGLDGIFFSCATDLPEGFDQVQLDQVGSYLPYLALALKSRITYDVASTVIGIYIGKDAGHRVLTGAIERGSSESIRAVIWFSDLRGFTRLTDRLPKNELVAMLDDYLEAMAGPVEEHQGQILKFMGDGLLATFDLTGRDEAAVCRDALKAAAELQASFPTFNKQRAAEGKPVMDFGLALHLGEVLYGNIGASERLDFTVVGPAVNEASRIQALCRPLERNVLISSTFEAAAGNGADNGTIALQSLGFHGLRGVREPQELFTLGG